MRSTWIVAISSHVTRNFTPLKASRVQNVFAKPCTVDGLCVFVITITSIRWISIGNKCQLHWYNLSLQIDHTDRGKRSRWTTKSPRSIASKSRLDLGLVVTAKRFTNKFTKNLWTHKNQSKELSIPIAWPIETKYNKLSTGSTQSRKI